MPEDMRTYYSIEVRPLAGRTLVIPGDLTSTHCHIRVAEIMPGIVIRFAVDTNKGIVYLDNKAELTW